MTRTEDGETITYTLGVDDQLATYGRAASPLAADGGSYTYNAAGCVTRIERDGRPTLDLTWNGQYQPVSVSTNGVFAESYAYDALGRRVSTTTQEGTVRHVYDDSWQCLADIDGNGNVLRSYVWGEGIDNLLAVKIGDESYYPLTDIQGTVWGYADSANNVVARWTYDAWGNILSEEVAVLALASVRYRFQGREWSAAMGLVNFRFRWYDAVTGRWLSKDPIGLGGGLNLYMYCGSDGINTRDPSGGSRVIITDRHGGEKVLRNPTLDAFKKAIREYDDNSINDLTIYGHGWVNMMQIDGDDDGCYINDRGNVVFDDGTSVGDLLRPKMSRGGLVYLSGCLTGYEGIFYSGKNNIAKALSSELPGVRVKGNRRFAIGNKIGPTWNFGISRTYINGRSM